MTDARAAVRRAAARLAPISLAEVLEVAELQSRVDRKYLVSPAQFDDFVRSCGDNLRVLEIDGLRDFRYESVYFDTPELAAYHQAATGRRNKFKVRTRTYVDSEACMLEVKTKGGRGETVKTRMPYPLDRREVLDVDAGDRVLWSLGERPVPISKYCVGLAMLRPQLPANRWNRTLRRYFDWEPARTPLAAA